MGKVVRGGPKEADTRLKIRIGFNSVNTLHRQLLLTMDPNTSLGYDWGYDAPSNDNQKDDMYWMIDNEKYVIQGIDKIDDETIIPIGVHTDKDGLNSITIDKIENNTNNLNVFLHDKELEIYHNIMENEYEVYLIAGEYLNRFEIVFSDITQESLSAETFNNDVINVYYSNDKTSIVLLNPKSIEIESAELFNILGQSVIKFDSIENTNYQEFKTNQLNGGSYILTITSKEGTISKKVLIK